MNRSLASKAVKAGSRAAADSPNRVSRVNSPDRAASTAVSKSRGKADRVNSAEVSPPHTINLSPVLAGDFFRSESPFLVPRRSPL